jgi:hypothetical protein
MIEDVTDPVNGRFGSPLKKWVRGDPWPSAAPSRVIPVFPRPRFASLEVRPSRALRAVPPARAARVRRFLGPRTRVGWRPGIMVPARRLELADSYRRRSVGGASSRKPRRSTQRSRRMRLECARLRRLEGPPGYAIRPFSLSQG